MSRHALPVLAGILAAGTLITGAQAASSTSRSDLTARTLNPTRTTISGSADTARTATLRARISVPRSWRATTVTPSLQTYRVGSGACVYVTRVRTSLVISGADDAASLASDLTPASGPYVLDSGTRGRAAWRVTRVRTSTGRTSLKAVGVYPRSLGQSSVVGAGRQAYQLISVTAADRPGDECHTGTYRESLGPQIGDALAIAKTRAYVDLKLK